MNTLNSTGNKYINVKSAFKKYESACNEYEAAGHKHKSACNRYESAGHNRNSVCKTA